MTDQTRSCIAVALGASLLGLLIAAGEGRCDIYTAESSTYDPTTIARFTSSSGWAIDSGPPTPIAGGKGQYTLSNGPPWPSLPYTLTAQVCRAGLCSADSNAITVTSPPPSRTAVLTAPLIKSAVRLDSSTISVVLKDYDYNANPGGVRVPTFVVQSEAGPPLRTEAPSTLSTDQSGLPGNERRYVIGADTPGCTEVWAQLHGGGAISPPSAPFVVGVCGQLPPAPPAPDGCSADLNRDGAVGLDDVAITFGLAVRGATCP